MLASAIDGGIPEDELGERINASDRIQLLTGFALSVQNDNTSEAIERQQSELEKAIGKQYARDGRAGACSMRETGALALSAPVEFPELTVPETWHRA